MDTIILIKDLLNIILRNMNFKTYISFRSTCQFLRLTTDEITQLRMNYLHGIYFYDLI